MNSMTGYVPCITQGGPGSVYPGTYKAIWDTIDRYNIEHFGCTQEELDANRLPMNIMFSMIPGAGEYFDHLLWHELFHCLTRNNPDFRADMYSLIHFTVEDSDYELPPCVREKFLSNPDVEHHDAHAAFIIDGQEKECFVAWIATMDYTEAQSSSESMTATALIPIDGTDIYYTKEQASNFDEVFGTNTGYTIDPEECMADNFADAMQYGMDGKNGQGYPNPEIIRGVIDRVSTGHFLKK